MAGSSAPNLLLVDNEYRGMYDLDESVVDGVDESRRGRVHSFVTNQRAQASAKRAFGTDQPVTRNEIQMTGAGIRPKGDMTDKEFEAFSETMSSEPGFSRADSRTFRVSDASELDAPQPFQAATDRSAEALEDDRQQKARVTTDPYTYAADPNSYDYPFVDTPPEFTDEFAETSSLTGQRFDFDSIREQDDSVFTF
jgi:hypothetical protein